MLFISGMQSLHGLVNQEVFFTMIDKLFDGIRWMTMRIDRAARAVFNVVFPALYIMMLMAMAVAECVWLTVMSLTKWPRVFVDAWGERHGWR
jgi:hypothetical protein